MWNTLKRFFNTLDEQGRTRFARLASDQERTSATLGNIGIGAAFGFALLASLYFVLYAILAVIYLRDDLGNPKLWLAIYYISLIFGFAQGGPLGGILGAGLSLKWQGKRNKAATTSLLGGGLVLLLMGLYQAQFYDPSFPPDKFILLALLMFSPGYLVATGIAAWGINLLNEKR